MTDLTEQWEIGKLKTNKYYYVRDISYISPAKLGKYDNQLYFSGNEVGYGYEENKELEVLAPVPSYEEWQAKLEENAQLKKQINHLLKTQARQFADNQKLQVKAEKAKDVVNIDTARQIKQLKELLKECRNKWVCYKPYDRDRLLKRIDEVLK